MPITSCLLHPVRALVLSLLIASCAQEAAARRPRSPSETPQIAKLTIVGTNDLHGWIAPHVTTLKSGATVEQGGLVALGGYLSILRAERPDAVVLVDAGDLFQGTLASNLSEGEVVIDAMNALGYDAAALGNHEFDFGPVGPRSVAQPGDDPFGALRARVAQARFPILAVNVTEAATGRRPGWLPPGTTLVERAGVKVGILGLSTPSTPKVTHPVNVASLRFAEMTAPTLEAARALRARGASVVIAVAHAGAVCAKDTDASTCNRGDSEIIELVESLPEGTLDAVVAGHTHRSMGLVVRGTPIIETSGLGRAFGLIELQVDVRTRKVLKDATRVQPSVPVCLTVDERAGTCDARAVGGARDVKLVPARFLERPVVADAELAALIAPSLARVEEEQRRPLGIQVAATLRPGRVADNPLGNLIADGLRGASGADVAVVNAGGIRAPLDGGELTYGQLFEVLPFDNTVAVLSLTPEELRALLNVALGRAGSFMISGLAVTLEECPGKRAIVSAVRFADGRPLPADDGGLVRVAMPDFLARGGSGLDMLKGIRDERVDVSNVLTLRDALLEHWRASGSTVAAPRGRRVERRKGAPDVCALR